MATSSAFWLSFWLFLLFSLCVCLSGYLHKWIFKRHTRSLNLITPNVMDAEIRSDLARLAVHLQLRSFIDTVANDFVVPFIYFWLIFCPVFIDLVSLFIFFFVLMLSWKWTFSCPLFDCIEFCFFFYFIRTLLLLTHQTINNSTFWWESQAEFCCCFCCITSLLSIFIFLLLLFVIGKYKCHDLARRPFNA